MIAGDEAARAGADVSGAATTRSLFTPSGEAKDVVSGLGPAPTSPDRERDGTSVASVVT